MNKDIITIRLEDGSYKDMEVILLYSDKKTKRNYIIYKELNSNKDLYVAKYEMQASDFVLDTDLSKNELKMMEEILNDAIKE